MMFDVYGRMRLEIVREEITGLLYQLEPGKRAEAAGPRHSVDAGNACRDRDLSRRPLSTKHAGPGEKVRGGSGVAGALARCENVQGSCHCGAVRFEADLDLEQSSYRCNCSICRRNRFWPAVATPEHFDLLAGSEM
jgi:hypothetical protein